MGRGLVKGLMVGEYYQTTHWCKNILNLVLREGLCTVIVGVLVALAATHHPLYFWKATYSPNMLILLVYKSQWLE